MNQDSGKFSAIGTVYAIDETHRTGQIRLIDNRRVQFDFSAIKNNETQLRLKDEVHLEAIATDDGLTATSIILSTKVDLFPAVPPTNQRLPEKDSSVKEAEAPAVSIPKSRLAISSISPSKVQEIYAQAAVARTEGRTADARALFEQALTVGAGPDVYTAYFKLLSEGRETEKARDLMSRAINEFPSRPDFYVMYGHMERRASKLVEAERILRVGLIHFPTHTLLRTGLAQVLAQIATATSLKEAGEIFDSLEAAGKLNKSDRTYMRFRALARNARAGRAYSFFNKVNGFFPELAGRRDLAPEVTDLVIEIKDQELDASFGISGGYLVRCFTGNPRRADIVSLSKFLRSLGAETTVGLISGREVLLNASLAFVVVPKTSTVRDYLMSVLSENNEALLPIDDQFMQLDPAMSDPKMSLRELFSQYLGARDLYDSTLPVSGRRLFGRERLLVGLADQAHKGDFIGIFGLRKMGKTSLMYQLRDEKLKDEAVAYVDLQASPGLAIGSFLPVLWEIERDLLERLVPRYAGIKDILRLGKFTRYSDAALSGVNPALLFSEDIRELLDLIVSKGIPGVSRLVIIIDELERCLPLAGQPPMSGYIEFFGLLRGLAQTDRYRGVISSVVVAANASISEKAYWEGRENPVFALYKPMFLPPLSKTDTAQMIQNLGKGMSVYWEAPAIDEVFSECGGHPFLTRILCSQLAKRHVQRPLQVTDRMVRNEISAFIRDKSDKFEQITELLHAHFPDEELLLEQLALGAQPVGASAESIRHLVGYHLIRDNHGIYQVSLNALNLWLKRRAGVQSA